MTSIAYVMEVTVMQQSAHEGPIPAHSPRELMIVVAYADGNTAADVALALGIAYQTVRSSLRRTRVKYRAAGRPASTRLQLRIRLLEDGYLEE